MNFKKNSPPSNGNCSINPFNGTTTTLFNISCSNWFDENGIKDYSFYGFFFFSFLTKKFFFLFLVWTNDYSKLVMIGFSLTPTFQVRLPKSFLINVNVHIRDKYDCIKEYNISPIDISDDSKEIEIYLKILKNRKLI